MTETPTRIVTPIERDVYFKSMADVSRDIQASVTRNDGATLLGQPWAEQLGVGAVVMAMLVRAYEDGRRVGTGESGLPCADTTAEILHQLPYLAI